MKYKFNKNKVTISTGTGLVECDNIEFHASYNILQTLYYFLRGKLHTKQFIQSDNSRHIKPFDLIRVVKSILTGSEYVSFVVYGDDKKMMVFTYVLGRLGFEFYGTGKRKISLLDYFLAFQSDTYQIYRRIKKI